MKYGFASTAINNKPYYLNTYWYKIKIQKLVAFLYTTNEISERECKKK